MSSTAPDPDPNSPLIEITIRIDGGSMDQQRPLNFQNYITKSTINVHQHNGPGRPPLPQSKDDEIKARIEPDLNKQISAFCVGRRITRSDYLRGLVALDSDYFDHINLLNDPEVKQLIFSMLRLAKKI